MLVGPSIQLRTVRATDVDDLYRHHTNLASRGTYFPRDVESEPAFRRAFEEGGWWEENSGTLLIVEPDGTVVGDIGFFRCRPGGQWTSYELYYQLFEPDRAARGYVTEALQLITDYLFETRPVLRLQLHIHADNVASQRIAEKCGYTFEGTARGVYFMNGAAQDLRVYSILPTDPRPKPTSP